MAGGSSRGPTSGARAGPERGRARRTGPGFGGGGGPAAGPAGGPRGGPGGGGAQPAPLRPHPANNPAGVFGAEIGRDRDPEVTFVRPHQPTASRRFFEQLP